MFVKNLFMTTVKFTIKKTPNSSGLHSIIIVIVKDRKNSSLSIGRYCKFEEWSFEAERLKVRAKDYKTINAFIDKYSRIAKNIIDDYELKSIPYTINNIFSDIKKQNNNKTESFIGFYKKYLFELKGTNQLGTLNSYKDALKQLQNSFGNYDFQFHEITPDFLSKLESIYRKKGNNTTTIGIRMRSYRAVFNIAISRGVTNETIYPFKKYKIPKPTSENKKEYLSEEEIRSLEDFAPKNKSEELAKDMFLLSYYCRGINFIDLLKLKQNNITEGRLSYIRTKTGAFLDFELIPQAKLLLEKYISLSKTKHLLPFVNYDNVLEEYYKNRTKKILTPINKTFREDILPSLKIEKKITYYCARHSFATKLKFRNFSIDFISQTLGHRDIKSTISYLNKLPSPKLDKMVSAVFKD